MAGRTTNYGWTKPEANDYVEASVLAEVFEAVDGKMKEVENHGAKKDNPHGVTKTQVGLGNVPNVATNDQTPTYTAASSLTGLTSGEKLSVAFGKLAKAVSDLMNHLTNKNNPHGVTAAQVGAAASGHTHSNYAASGHDHANQTISPGAIEVKPASGASHGGYIDFHFGGSTADNTSRIMETAEGRLNVSRDFNVAGNLMMGGNVVFNLNVKPVGEYTGNGGSNTIDLGTTASSKMVYIGSSRGVALVTQTGAFCLSSGAVSGVKYSDANYGVTSSKGKLSLNTSNICLNETGTKYTYWTI